ncbi:MAG TPA: phospholipase D-like domain-containing protein [Anaerovoracaceae bacterium]|nr:phospholipase D-like domain-containing protein [Anaerovoracaceae bacterium]
MPYYHVVINKKSGKQPLVFRFNLSKHQIDELTVDFMKKSSFMFGKFVIQPLEIESIRITETEEKAKKILLNGSKKRTFSKTVAKLFSDSSISGPHIDEWHVINSGKDVTKDLTAKLGEIKVLQTEDLNLIDAQISSSPDFKNKDLDVHIVEWKKLTDKITSIQADMKKFEIEFLDRDSFKGFCDNLSSNLMNLNDICLTGYFSQTIRTELENIALNRDHRVRLISPDFQLGTNRDKKNLEVLRKLSKSGVEVRFNYRIHARLLIAKNPLTSLLILGSFDYDTECIGTERYDAGIKTSHPDLVKAASDFFEQVWNDSETQSLKQFLKNKKI